ncbi:MAG: redox-regulated ATPase YchF [SAR116 cluster bacterium]|mgnify:FL=1|nr:redox-regulated ATPase YchF [SAR116 cluster bacterium]MEC8662012.1 redox-regulated ATPase YchF [Pseudomonadota bacterium]HCI19315.1 redox-regulated ATPase YchF [Alphaproteobacteria bacterium]
MGFNCGIVGLPNVGKSTLFNALTETAAAEAANYPFCTIEPNTGRVAVPDPRLDALASLAGSATVIPTQLEFVDIAGLVRGASKGEGLGNQFLANIREVDAIAHVLRCFDDSEITHVDGSVDPLRDAATVETELMLADIDSLERRMAALVKKTRGGDADAKRDLAMMEKLFAGLSDGVPARRVAGLSDDETRRLPQMQLLSAKPVLYVCNVAESDAATGNDHSQAVAAYAEKDGAAHVVVSAAIEAEITQLDADDKAEFLAELGLDEAGLARLIRAGYGLLDLLTFFTAGPKEARAWTVAAGSSAPEAAGAIHTDFQRGFIRAETISFDDYIACKGESGARDAGKLRIEGADYKVVDGDVFHFRFNV